MAGTWAIIGDPTNDAHGSNAGRAFVYKYDYTTFQYVYKAALDLPASLRAAERYYGFYVAISSNYAVVISKHDGSYGTVSLFKRDTDTSWSHKQEFSVDEPNFGKAIYLGTRRIISSDSAVHVYQGGTAWTNFNHLGTLLPPDESEKGNFGNALNMEPEHDGSYVYKIWVCDSTCSKGGAGRGAIHRYDTGLNYVDTIQPSGIADGDRFGASLARFQGSSSFAPYFVVGAPGTDSNKGKVYLYQHREKSTENYMAEPTLLDSFAGGDSVAGDNFGEAVAAGGYWFVVGAPDKQVGADASAGRLYVFSPNPEDVEVFAQRRTLDGTAANQRRGARLSMRDDTASPSSVSHMQLLVGIYGSTVYEYTSVYYRHSNQGAVHVYTDSGTYVERLTAPTYTEGGSYGFSIDAVGDWLAVCDPDGGANGAGRVHMYEWSGSAYVYDSSLTGTGTVAGDWFGREAKLDRTRGNLLVVASLEINGDGNGGVFIFAGAGAWLEDSEVLTDVDVYGEAISYSLLDVDDWTIVAGTPLEASTGKLRLYEFVDSQFQLVRTLTAPAVLLEEDATLNFGYHPSLYGDKVVCGTDCNYTVGGVTRTSTGIPVVYRRTSGVWADDPEVIYPPEFPTINWAGFGNAFNIASGSGSPLCLWDEFLVIGAPWWYYTGSDALQHMGRVFVYWDPTGLAFEKIHEFVSDYAEGGDEGFGASVTMADEIIGVGAPREILATLWTEYPTYCQGVARFFDFPPQIWNHHTQTVFAAGDETTAEFDTSPELYEDFEEDWNASNASEASGVVDIGDLGGASYREDYDNWTSEMTW